MVTTLIPLVVSAPAATTPMTMHTIEDPTAIHGVAYRYLAPKGWKAQARVDWQAEVASPTALTAVAISPDERYAYLIAQGQEFRFFVKNGGMWVNVMTQGMKQGITPPERFSDFLLDYAKRILKADLKVTKRQDQRLSGAQLPRARNLGAIGQVEFTFTEPNGTESTGVVAGTMDGDLQGDTVHAGMSYQGDWRIENLFLIGAPKGEERKGMRFFSLGVPTYTPTRPFLKARGAYQMVLNHQIDVRIRDAGEVSKATAKLSAQMEDAIMGRYRSEQQGNDKAQSGFCDMIRDVEQYRGKDGEQIRVASTPGGAWQSASGAVILSDDPHYDPNGPGSLGWSRLQRAH